ncbi:MAG: tandem-95 repeat protein, partial [Algicola sp.]|nr:tandem-95 repeat protein [Algicola sp.]
MIKLNVFTHKKLTVPVVSSYFTSRSKNNRQSLKTSLLALVVSSFLTACGGGSGGEITPQTQPTPTIPDPSPDPTPIPGTGALKVIDFDYIQRSAGAAYNPGQVQTAAFANASGTFRLPLTDQNLTGNLTVSVDLTDPDGIAGVYYGFTGTTKVEALCTSNCGTDYHRTVTGINPLDHGVTSGNQRLELWVGDNIDNLVTVGTVNFNWHVTPVTGINATRANNTINLGWNPLNNYLRYNVYVASQPGVTPDNYQTLADGQAFLALRDSALALDHKEDSRNFYTMITGIDGSGESAFGEPMAILALAEVIDLPPDAVDDAFSMNEDESLTASVLGNDSDLESAFVTISTAPIIPPENGQLAINADGTFTYSPDSNFSGRDGFTYQISDGVGNTDIAVVSITVLEANDPPQPSFNNFNIELGAAATANTKSSTNTNTSSNAQTFNLSAATNELIVLAPGLLINDLDIDSGVLKVLLDPVEGPFQGTLILQEDGGFSYTADAGATDTDTFTYRTIDGTGATADSVVLITINGGNFFPVAANDRYTLNEDETFNSTISTNNPSILSNDFDLDTADTLTLVTQLEQATSHGILNLAPDGTFTYQPNAGYYGIDSFKYRISDPQGALAEAAVILTIVKKNNPPFAVLDIYRPSEDTTFNVSAIRGVLANDSDPDFDPKFVTTTPVEAPIHGQLTLSADGSFSYIPEANFFGTDSFRYEVKDDSGLSAIGTVRLTVINVNDNPVAIDDNAQTTGVNPVVIDVLDNDTDIEGNILKVDSATVPANVGSSIVDTDNTLTFIPKKNFDGVAEIDYTISDGAGGTASAKVFVSVNVLNTAPVAVDDNYTTTEDQNFNVNGNNQPRLLANDSDADGNAISVDRVPLTDVSHGKVTLSSNGTFNYRPDNDFFGEDFFVYQIRDNQGGFASATATLNVAAVNDAPQAFDDSVSTSEETLLNINVLSNDVDVDNDTLTISTASASNGTTTILANNTLDYTPNLNYVGTDEISYSISDGNGSSDSAVVTVNVLNVNDAPSANNDFISAVEGTPVTINVLTNDTDIDGDNLTVTQAIASNGSTVINGGTSVTYTPNFGFSGIDNVVYFISDGNGGNDNATIIINVVALGNELPVANDDTASTVQDVTVDINVLANDSDPDGDVLSVFDVNAILGSVSILANNNLRFIPLSGFVGTDTISYNIDDGRGGLASAIVTVTINAVVINSPPVANNDSATTNEDTALSIDVLSNDSDVDNDPLTINSATATLGSVSIAANNNL